MRVIWTHRALAHLREIAIYIRAESPSAARRTHQKIRNATRRLVRFPRSGRIIPEIDMEPFREVIVDGYRILYEVTEAEVTILGVIHSRRDLAAIWPFEGDPA